MVSPGHRRRLVRAGRLRGPRGGGAASGGVGPAFCGPTAVITMCRWWSPP